MNSQQLTKAWYESRNHPIFGSQKVTQLQENFACLEFELTPEQIQRLDAVSAIELGFSHDFLKSSMIQDFAFGGESPKLTITRL